MWSSRCGLSSMRRPCAEDEKTWDSHSDRGSALPLPVPLLLSLLGLLVLVATKWCPAATVATAGG